MHSKHFIYLYHNDITYNQHSKNSATKIIKNVSRTNECSVTKKNGN